MDGDPTTGSLWVRSLAGAIITLIVASLFYAVAVGIVNFPHIGV